MNFININSKYIIAPWQISLVKEVLQANIKFPNHTLNLWDLFHKTPFFLVDEIAFNRIKSRERHYERDIELDFLDNDKEIEENNINPFNNKRPNTEVFGFYVSKGRHDISEIYLCIEAILRYSNNDQDLSYMLAKVIIHELAHAYLDATKTNYGEKDEFYYWMEESFANKITMDHFEEYKKYNKYSRVDQYLSHNHDIYLYNYVKDFILSQPDNYKLGYFLHRFNFHFEDLWSINKDKIKNKLNEKDNWLNYVKSNIDTGNYDEDTIFNLTKLVCQEENNEVTEINE